MSLLKSRLVGCALLLAATGSLAMPASQASTYYHRQYYSSWKQHPYNSYYYRSYYYKPTPTYAGYSYHYAVYYPSRPSYVYYYNPYKRQYWGRALLNHEGKAQYQLLA